jgi:hypothetical protein
MTMTEFMLLVRNVADHQAAWTADRHLAFLRRCEVYIGELKAAGKLVAAQPLVKEGRVISGASGTWSEAPLDRSVRIQVGYYHVRALDMDDAIAIAKANPEFEFSSSAQVEVRMIKGREAETGFVYPT